MTTENSTDTSADFARPILHVVVIGFHHKKGCQVEYSFPPLVVGQPSDSPECPGPWKYLPTLALPDGSHNYEEDTVYFHLPSLTNPKQTVFGISCFCQIDADKLVNKTADITRSTVQKSVCVLSTVPLFGHIQVKMNLVTHAYFKEGDFSRVQLLEDTYVNLNNCLKAEMLYTPEVFVGLSLREFILQFRHKVLLLFKLVLLEKRVLFFKSPVSQLCSTILSLLSLFPCMVEKGLSESACVKPSRPMSPVPQFTSDTEEIENVNNSTTELKRLSQGHSPNQDTFLSAPEENVTETTSQSEFDSLEDVCGSKSSLSSNTSMKTALTTSESLNNITSKVSALKGRLSGAFNYWSGHDSTENELENESVSSEMLEKSVPNMVTVSQLSMEECSLPLSIFTKGYLCHPYLSLPYLDLLSDVNVRGYIVGATNVLFKQKRNFADVLIEIDGSKIEIQGSDLKRHLHLTTEDLRFADYIVKHVVEDKHDVFFDGVGWEGGDEWIRMQFKLYLLTLLRTSLLEDGSRELDHFNSSFITAWRATHNYKIWSSSNTLTILEVNPGHPFAGQLSVADMKLRWSHTMQTTEGGRKLNQAVSSTGRAVAQTGKAVGGALSQAKGAFSTWWSTFAMPATEANGDLHPDISASVKGSENGMFNEVDSIK